MPAPSLVAGLEEKLGYRFSDPQLLVRALTHRSSLSDKTDKMPAAEDNEQLEFLGDSVLGFIVCEALLSASRCPRRATFAMEEPPGKRILPTQTCARAGAGRVSAAR